MVGFTYAKWVWLAGPFSCGGSETVAGTQSRAAEMS